MAKRHSQPSVWQTFIQTISFVVLLLVYVLFRLTIQKLLTWNAFGHWQAGQVRLKVLSMFMAVMHWLDVHPSHSISRIDLINLSLENLKIKKTRSLVTIGGMSIGIAVIVFLVSIGYGLQNVVISRIASLDEMRQTDVATQPGSQLVLNDKALADFANIDHIQQVLPQIAVVAKVSFGQSQADLAAYGVTTDYLSQSAIKASGGKIFTSNAQTVSANQLSQPVASSSATPQSTTSASLVASAQPVSLSAVATKQAVVNQAMLQLLSIPAEAQAVGQTFSSSFVATTTANDGTVQTLQSLPVDYTIVAVIPDQGTPLFYVPFIDLRSMGISQYSQVKLVVDKQANLNAVRQRVETLGYSSQSVVDTVAQVNTLFNTLRTLLIILGVGALFVASLGMFNTLTVSLLERTREVGLMKSMGMRSFEVRELFLTESMIMGLAGGILGLLLGIILGKTLSLGLSVLSLSQGSGFIDVSIVPWTFAAAIIGTSLLVGFLTGLFPARRATRISALNALRYE